MKDMYTLGFMAAPLIPLAVAWLLSEFHSHEADNTK